MNNIQKAFKAKSKLRGMADGGSASEELLGDGMAGRAASLMSGRQRQIDAAVDAATGTPAPAPAPEAPADQEASKKPKEKSALRSFFGLADGGQIFKNTVGGVPTFTDARGASAGAQAYTPGQPTAPAAPAALATPPNVSPLATPAPTIATAIAPAPADTDRILNSRDMSIFSPQETRQFNEMGNAASDRARAAVDLGVQAGQSAMRGAPAQDFSSDEQTKQDFFEFFADGGKVKGEGGPTEDEVGPVMLSNGEYVLPADTVKAIGRDKLDQLRLETHDFVDEDNKPVSKLRKMANGGTFYVDPSGIASDVLRNQPRLPGPIGPGPTAPPPTIDPRVTDLAKRMTPPSGMAKLGAGLAAPTAAIAAGKQVMGDVGDGGAARRQFEASVGMGDSTAGTIGASALRTMSNVGNALTGGYAQTVGERLSDMFTGTKTPAAGAQPATAQQPGNTVDTAMTSLRAGQVPGGGFTADPRYSTPGATVFGRDNPNAGPDQAAREYVGAGRPAPQQGSSVMDELRSVLRDAGGGQQQASFADSRRGEREINQRYDALSKRLGGMYSAKGQGNLARRLLELEGSRSNALEGEERNRSMLRGQELSSSTSANNAALQARMQGIQSMATLAGQQTAAASEAQKNQLKLLEAARESEAKGFDRYTDAIGGMFIDGEGKPDKQEQERFTSFLQASDPKAQEKFSAMQPQDQMKLLQDFKVMYEMNKARNNTATRGLLNAGAITNKMDMPTDVREASFNDVWNNHLPVGDYLYSNLPFTNPNVVTGESGQPVLLSDMAKGRGGNWDADKLKLIEQRTGKNKDGRRSSLRGE